MNVQGALKKRDTADKISNVRGAWVMLFCYSKLVFTLAQQHFDLLQIKSSELVDFHPLSHFLLSRLFSESLALYFRFFSEIACSNKVVKQDNQQIFDLDCTSLLKFSESTNFEFKANFRTGMVVAKRERELAHRVRPWNDLSFLTS